MNKKFLFSTATAMALVFGGCAPMNTPKPSSSEALMTADGVVVSSTRVKVENTGISAGEIVGGAIGGALGGLLGNQIGGGSGKAVATGAGAVGGAVLGAQKGKEFFGEKDFHDEVAMSIKLDKTGEIIKTQTPLDEGEFRKGDKVRIAFDRKSGDIVDIEFLEAEENVKIVEKEKVVVKDRVVEKKVIKKIYVKQPTPTQTKSVSVTKTTAPDGKVTVSETKTLNNVGDFKKAFSAVREQ